MISYQTTDNSKDESTMQTVVIIMLSSLALVLLELGVVLSSWMFISSVSTNVHRVGSVIGGDSGWQNSVPTVTSVQTQIFSMFDRYTNTTTHTCTHTNT